MGDRDDIISLRIRRSVSIIAAIILAFLISSSLLVFAQADSINPGVFSKDSSPNGIPYGEWIHRWWQWNMEIPTAEHPRDNYTPQKCTVNQRGPVWFLPDILSGKEQRTCTIPAGKDILVPLLTGECHNDGVPKPMNDQELRQCAMAGNEYGVISATLDGKPLKNPEQYRIQTAFYNITVPEDNILKNKPGTFRGVADGFFIFLEPLSAGEHELHLKTSVSNPIQSEYNFAAEVAYQLIVK